MRIASCLLALGCADTALLEVEVVGLRERVGLLESERAADAERLEALERRVSDLSLTGRERLQQAVEAGSAVGPAPIGRVAEDAARWVVHDEDGWAIRREALTLTDETWQVARALPHRGSDGEFDGYRLSAVGRESPLWQLGFLNGDIVRTVDGIALVSAANAQEAWQRVAKADNFVVRIDRRGAPLEIAVRVR